MFFPFFLILVGLGLLIFGADVLVKGSSSISKQLGIPQIVIGLTIVAFGTSAPELVINVISAFEGTTDLAIGNIVGSNIGNILLILGVSLIICNISVHKNTAWKEIPFAILGAGILLVMTSDITFNGDTVNILSKTESFTLLGFFMIFLYYVLAITLGNSSSENSINEIPVYPLWQASLYTLIGLVMLFIGGKVLVENAVILAKIAGISEIVIGLTIVAIGTSLPELVTCVIAAMKKQTDIVIGNVIGSNIFNTFWILGVTGTISPVPISDEASFDILFSVVITLGVFLFLFLEKDIYIKGGFWNHIRNSERYVLRRWHGVILIGTYIAYLIYLISRG